MRVSSAARQGAGSGGFCAAYNCLVHRPPLPPLTAHSFWSRLAAFLSFVAVLSALLVPVSMLAQDVQNGELGGVCSLNNFVAASRKA